MNTDIYPEAEVVDLFAGPGGWSVAVEKLGLREVGIEFDRAAALTRGAAGHATILDDVRRWGPVNFPNARGLIASPPCQTFSAAGKGAGRRALDVVLAEVDNMRHCPGHIGPSAVEWEDERTGLVLEPLRWALDAIRLGRPYEWLAFEQVPTVLPVWQAMADVLRAEGYSVATGNLQAEQYGVPQTRKRAVLIARLVGEKWMPCDDGPLSLPTPTHSRYHTRDKTQLDPGVQPWMSMAQGLDWPVTDRGPSWPWERPATTVVGSFNPAVIAAPGWRVKAEHGPRQNAPGSVRVTVDEAGRLQSFPAGYPWQGSESKQRQQIGNAIPPLLAEAILRQVV